MRAELSLSTAKEALPMIRLAINRPATHTLEKASGLAS